MYSKKIALGEGVIVTGCVCPDSNSGFGKRFFADRLKACNVNITNSK
jgi:hypothetical protein